MRRLVFVLGLTGILGFSSWMIYLASRPHGNDSMLSLSDLESHGKGNGSEILGPDPTFRPPESEIIGDLGPVHEWEKDPIVSEAAVSPEQGFKNFLNNASRDMLITIIESQRDQLVTLRGHYEEMTKIAENANSQQPVFVPANNDDYVQRRIAAALEDRNNLIREQRRQRDWDRQPNPFRPSPY